MKTPLQRPLPNLRWLKIATLIVVAAGVLLRFVNLDNKPFWWDETLALTFAAGYTRGEIQMALQSPPYLKTPDQILRFQRAGGERGLTEIIRPLRAETVHPPLFYVLLHVWQRHAADSMRAIRALPALLSLLVLPAAWWCCREIFASNRVAFLAVSLLSISPLHVIYAQEVKQYSLWTVMILATGAALLRALRHGSRRSWLLFSALAVAGLYTHLFTGFLLMGLGVYVLYRSRWRLSDSVTHLFASSILIGFAFAPWLLALTRPSDTMMRFEHWAGGGVSTTQLLARWSDNLPLMLFDFSNLAPRWTEGPLDAIGFVFVAALTGSALFNLIRTQEMDPLWFLLAMALPGAAFLAGWDALEGGIRSTVPRFLIPSYLGLHLAIAHLFSEKLQRSSSGWIRSFWILVLAGLWCLGSLSAWANSRSHELWSKPQSGAIHQAGETINENPNALVLYTNIPVLSLVWELDPDVRLMDARRWLSEQQTKSSPEADEVFTYALLKRIRKQFSATYELTPANDTNAERAGEGVILYRLARRADAM